MASRLNTIRPQLQGLLDAANGALERHDRRAAAEKFAQASGLLFELVLQTGRVEEKLQLARRARELLATASELRGEAPAAPPDAAGPPDPAATDDGAPAAGPRRLQTTVKFADIAGLEDVKETLRLRVIYPLQQPETLGRFGLEMGGGMLLYGPPGTGKTMIAKAVAGELALPFFPVKPSEILGQYYGQSEKQLAALFDHVRGCTGGAVVFLDEIDAIGAARNREGASEPTRRLLNQLLQELDGVGGRPQGLLFLAATNEPWLLDEALLRPPRFTEKCYIPLPDALARRALLAARLRDCPLAGDVDFDRFAESTDGYSGADLVNLCERAKLIPYRQAVLEGVERPVMNADLEEALGRVRPSVSTESLRRYEEWATSR